MAGYQVVCLVENQSSVGIADVAVRLRIYPGGDLERDGKRTNEALTFARRAVAAGGVVKVPFPHVVRLPLQSFDVDVDVGPGYTVTVYWRDDQGKRWKRTDGERAVTCRARDYPAQ